VLFWSGIWFAKLIFLKIIFKENFINLRIVIWIYIYTYSGTPPARPPTGRHLIGRVRGTGVVASHLHSSRFHVCYYRDHWSLHFCKSFLDWKLFAFVLRGAWTYRYCTIKPHNRKSRYRQYKFQKSLQYKFVHVTLAFTALALTPASLYPRCFRIKTT